MYTAQKNKKKLKVVELYLVWLGPMNSLKTPTESYWSHNKACTVMNRRESLCLVFVIYDQLHCLLHVEYSRIGHLNS